MQTTSQTAKILATRTYGNALAGAVTLRAMLTAKGDYLVVERRPDDAMLVPNCWRGSSLEDCRAAWKRFDARLKAEAV